MIYELLDALPPALKAQRLKTRGGHSRCALCVLGCRSSNEHSGVFSDAQSLTSRTARFTSFTNEQIGRHAWARKHKTDRCLDVNLLLQDLTGQKEEFLNAGIHDAATLHHSLRSCSRNCHSSFFWSPEPSKRKQRRALPKVEKAQVDARRESRRARGTRT